MIKSVCILIAIYWRGSDKNEVQRKIFLRGF